MAKRNLKFNMSGYQLNCGTNDYYIFFSNANLDLISTLKSFQKLLKYREKNSKYYKNL